MEVTVSPNTTFGGNVTATVCLNLDTSFACSNLSKNCLAYVDNGKLDCLEGNLFVDNITGLVCGTTSHFSQFVIIRIRKQIFFTIDIFSTDGLLTSFSLISFWNPSQQGGGIGHRVRNILLHSDWNHRTIDHFNGEKKEKKFCRSK